MRDDDDDDDDDDDEKWTRSLYWPTRGYFDNCRRCQHSIIFLINFKFISGVCDIMLRCLQRIFFTMFEESVTDLWSCDTFSAITNGANLWPWSINQSISTYLVPSLHKSGPTRHYKCHHSTRIVKTSAAIKAHVKKMSLEFPFESSSAVGWAYWLRETVDHWPLSLIVYYRSRDQALLHESWYYTRYCSYDSLSMTVSATVDAHASCHVNCDLTAVNKQAYYLTWLG